MKRNSPQSLTLSEIFRTVLVKYDKTEYFTLLVLASSCLKKIFSFFILLVTGERIPVNHFKVVVSRSVKELLRKNRYTPSPELIVSLKKVVFFGEGLEFSGVIDVLSNRYENIYLDQKTVINILINQYGLFIKDFLIYSESGRYHTFLLFKENDTACIVDVFTDGFRVFRAEVDTLENFILKHPRWSVYRSNDILDCFILPDIKMTVLAIIVVSSKE